MPINSEAVILAMVEETGINPSFIYCWHTGRTIGSIHASVFADVLTEIGSEDVDSIIDELLVRSLTNVRPSPLWATVDPETLRRYITTRPGEVLAYCLNRLYEAPDRLKTTASQRLNNYQLRIKRWEIIQRLLDSKRDLTQWLYMLVEIDAKYNLNKLPIPDSDIIATLTEMAQTQEAYDGFMESWKKWYFPLKQQYEKKRDSELREERWLRGNALVGPAYLKMFMESRPPTKTGEAKAKKAADSDFFDSIFSEVMNAKPSPHAERMAIINPALRNRVIAKPTKPYSGITTAPKRFGGLKNKDS